MSWTPQSARTDEAFSPTVLVTRRSHWRAYGAHCQLIDDPIDVVESVHDPASSRARYNTVQRGIRIANQKLQFLDEILFVQHLGYVALKPGREVHWLGSISPTFGSHKRGCGEEDSIAIRVNELRTRQSSMESHSGQMCPPTPQPCLNLCSRKRPCAHQFQRH